MNSQQQFNNIDHEKVDKKRKQILSMLHIDEIIDQYIGPKNNCKNIERKQRKMQKSIKENKKSIQSNRHTQSQLLMKNQNKIQTNISSSKSNKIQKTQKGYIFLKKKNYRNLQQSKIKYRQRLNQQAKLIQNNNNNNNILHQQKLQKQQKKKKIQSLIIKCNQNNNNNKFQTKFINRNKLYKLKSQINIEQKNNINQTINQFGNRNKKYDYSEQKLKTISCFKGLNSQKRSTKIGKIFRQRYQLINIIGRGMSGCVYKAKDILSNRNVVLKSVGIQSQEYQLIKKLQHSNIIGYYNNFIENKKRYLVLEYMPYTLATYLRMININEELVKKLFKGIANGLAYLHSLSIAHRDIKMENIVVSQNLNEVKFIDFGLCTELDRRKNQLCGECCGTISYLAPEIMGKNNYDPKKADIWALGILLYILITKRHPYYGKNQHQIAQKIAYKNLVYPKKVSQNLKDLLNKMLSKDPNNRPTILQIIGHDWL